MNRPSPCPWGRTANEYLADWRWLDRYSGKVAFLCYLIKKQPWLREVRMNRLFIIAAGIMFVTIGSVEAQELTSSPASQAAANNTISLKDVDTNHDGKVSTDESRALIRRLQQAEIERQRALKKAQMPAPAPAPAPVTEPIKPATTPKPVVTAPKKAEPVKKEWVPKVDAFENQQKKYDNRQGDMKAMDANGDGILQARELQASNKNKFKEADTNKDGVLSPEETAASLEKFKAEKAAIQGAAEAKNQAHRIENRYKQADKNRDGQVSQEEYTNFMNERQSTFDRNSDGIISEDEYRGDGEKTPSGYKPKKD